MPVTQWAVFDNCTVDPAAGPPSVRLRMAFTFSGQFTEEDFAVAELR